ncbi:phytanoyl-CoA dioxygenase family protein [Paractinoplanes lichenicola]|uniref:Phytanoyl-CoA dioxygenase family protein n=1 Tax=Paractinoplanes lichenicola TaxID=2802976 RepID=A0ABS1VV69_9ACTN|nr:phytanoyl-CoA dioxygenase family protein [Actinoplanes lichenicola]MBL7258328.1 phytanoyl-CoA dioxygenase family protein [Actinoplanes lichenicola]
MQETGFEAITEEQRNQFLTDGVLLVRKALDEERRARLEAAVDRVYAREREAGRLKPDGTLHMLGFLPRDEEFGELLTLPTTFPYVWGLAGWNIYTHHNHLDVTPPQPFEEEPAWGWHQDGYRQNSDPETLGGGQPRPMLSLKVAYVLSDLSRTGRGATKVIPGSHLNNTLDRPAGGGDPRGTMEITADPGDCFIFDRRLWHSRSPNRSTVTRKILFIGYTYRWVRPLDDMPIDKESEWWRNRTPVQRQLLGEAPHTANHWGVGWDGYIDEKIPLRHELSSRGLLDRSVPWLR